MSGRLVVIGLGAIGGVLAGRLARSGPDVIGVARGPHLDAIQADGLTVESPQGTDIVPLTAVGSVADITWEAGDVALLCTKSQATVGLLDELRVAAAGVDIGVACLQNGVANEREALRRFDRVYGVPVMCPAEHLEPGVVVAWIGPTTGVFDIGCWPDGVDDTCHRLAATFQQATYDSVARPDISRWKHTKLLMNLANALDALVDPAAGWGDLPKRARTEAKAVFDAAGIAYASEEEDEQRRGDLFKPQEVAGRTRSGSSTWQSFQRGSGSAETDWFNGEICLLGRLHGIPTPVNAALQKAAALAAAERRAPRSMALADVEALIDA